MGKRGLILLIAPLLVVVYDEACGQNPGEATTAQPVRIVRGCGRVRWDVKILADDDTALIDFRRPVATSVRSLTDMPSLGPDEWMPRQFSERRVYAVTAILDSWHFDTDRDISLVLRDPDAGRTIVASIPDPECPEVAATPRRDAYAALRRLVTDSIARLDARPLRVSVSGVGMYDRLMDQPGMATNGFVLHPVISIVPILPAPPPDSGSADARRPLASGVPAGGSQAAAGPSGRTATVRPARHKRTRRVHRRRRHRRRVHRRHRAHGSHGHRHSALTIRANIAPRA